MEEVKYVDIISDLLNKRKLSRRWLAQEIGLSETNFANMMRRGRISQEKLDKIQDVLHVNLYDLRLNAIKRSESIVAENATDYEEVYTIKLSRSELKQVLLNHNREIYELRRELSELQSKFRDHLYMSKDKP